MSSIYKYRMALGVLAPLFYVGLASAQDVAPEAEETPEAPPADTAVTEDAPAPEEESSDEAAPVQEEAAAEPAAAKEEQEKPAHEEAAAGSGEPGTQAGDGADEISDEELERFLEKEHLGGEGGFQPSLDLYGFADFTYSHYIIEEDSPWRLLFNKGGNFAVGNLNLYLDSQLTETVRALAEVRFSYLPNGTLHLGPPSRRETTSQSDYTRNERDSATGAIMIQRAWVNWSPHQLFTIKVGHWLTPYGVWNVDHGSPTIVPVTRPFMIDEQLLPESQTGILVEGRADLTDNFALEYGAGISNGRGPTDTVFDQNANKGLTGRLKLLYSGAGELQVGVSGYTGTYTEAQVDLQLDGNQLVSNQLIMEEFKEQSLAADIRYTNGGLLLQSEAMLNDKKFTNEGRPDAFIPDSLTPDTRKWGVYAIAGYRFDWYGVMPYIIGEFSPIGDPGIRELPQEIALFGGGLNIRPIAQVVIKLGYDQAAFPQNRDATLDQASIRRFQGQVAWAF